MQAMPKKSMLSQTLVWIYKDKHPKCTKLLAGRQCFCKVLLKNTKYTAIWNIIKSGIFTKIILMHKPSNYNSTPIHTNACRSARESAGLMWERNTRHLLKKFQLTVCQCTICRAADCRKLQNRRLIWKWATSFLPGPQIYWLMFSHKESFNHTPLWNLCLIITPARLCANIIFYLQTV